MNKEKVYLLCDWSDGKSVTESKLPLNIGIEHMGNCSGRIVHEDGSLIGQHFSSSFGWLRLDLLRKLGDDRDKYEIVDLIEQEVPTKFRVV